MRLRIKVKVCCSLSQFGSSLSFVMAVLFSCFPDRDHQSESDSDHELEEWERQQIRKGVSQAQVFF